MQQYIGFKIDTGEYAVPMSAVREIINPPELTMLPLSEPSLAGVTNLRGSVIPVVNSRKLIGLPEKETRPSKVIVIACGHMAFGVYTDGITGVVNIEESAIEPPEGLHHGHDLIAGIARQNGKVVIIVEPKKLIPVRDAALLEEVVLGMQATNGDNVAVTKTVQTMAGEIQVTEVRNAQEFLEKKRAGMEGATGSEIVTEMVDFMKAVSERDYTTADKVIESIVKSGQGELFKEVGKITRRLHDSLKSFEQIVDPRLKEMTQAEIPNAVDKLQYVITKTEEAANKTMSVVEKYIMRMDELGTHIRNVQGPPETVAFLKSFKNGLEDDLTEILTTQSFQDLTGQAIKKVILLVHDLEEELVRLITLYGLKMEPAKQPVAVAEKVSQAGVDDLLKELGF